MTPERYTIPDIARELDVRPNTVSGYHSRGQMPPASGKVGRTPYWLPEDVEPWIEGYLRGAASLRRERAARRGQPSTDSPNG